MKNQRLFEIVYLLLERGSMTAPQLAQQLEVSTRTIYRDVESLSMAGIPVVCAPGKGGGISLMPGYTVDRALLSEEEQNQLLFAIQSMGAAGQPVDALVQKLGSLFHKQETNWIRVEFSRWGLRQQDNQRFETLKKGILQRRMVSLQYCGVQGQTTHRQIKPFQLVFKNKSWYVRAFCMVAKDFRLFKLSRIREIALLEERFTDDFSQAPPLEGEDPAPGMGEELLLCIVPELAFRVYEEFGWEDISPQPDGRLLVRAVFPVDAWLESYLLSFGTGVEILQPRWLKDLLASRAEQIFLHHRET